MENNAVPYIAHESAMARLERIIKRLWIVIIILIALLFATNAAWIYYESRWEIVSSYTQEVTQETDGSGNNQFIGGDYCDKTESKDHQNDQP